MNAPLTDTRVPPAQRFEALQRRVQAGELPSLDEIVPLTRAADLSLRGLSKRLLAHTMIRQAQRTAGHLLCEACDDLRFSAPLVLQEALSANYQAGQWDNLSALSLRAAEQATRAGDAVQALVHLQNAVAADVRHGSRAVNDPRLLRRIVPAYRAAAELARRSVVVPPVERGRRRCGPNERLRVAHVVCQIIDGGHAPSRSIEATLRHTDRAVFDLLLCVTESLVRHERHTDQLFVSEPSAVRGAGRLAAFERDFGIPVLRPRTRASFVAAAADLHAQLAEREVDVAFFHGSLATPVDWLLCAWQAAPWQLDAGFGVPLHCPAVDFQFFEFEDTLEQLACLCREAGVPYGPKPTGADLSHVEQAAPFSRRELRVPAGHILLGTLGNHLEQRLSPAFCAAVAEVLRQRPETSYVVAGPGGFAQQRAAFGELCAGAGARVRFVGPTREAGRMTQSFDIYLNPFPDGGGYTLGDAMAASKPVVSIQMGASTYALAARVWLGAENLVEPATGAAYQERLRALIDGPAARRELGARLHQRYRDRFDIRRCVQTVNERILAVVHGSAAGA